MKQVVRENLELEIIEVDILYNNELVHSDIESNNSEV
jgi:hypothetical protein